MTRDRVCCCVVLLLTAMTALVWTPAMAAQGPAAPASFRSDPDFLGETAAARTQGSSLAEQIGHWQRASALAAGQCAECLERLATLNFRAADWEAAIRGARGFEAISTKPADKAYAELLHGSAAMHLNDDQPTPNELGEADEQLRAAIAADPTLRTALFLDGRALAALHRDEAARAAFTRYLQLATAEDRYRARAEQYLGNLKLARATMAPPFALTTMDGRRMTLDELRGKVVLLDFWATWCVPCQQFLPRLQRLAADLKDAPFTVISVSWDEDPAVWKGYVAAHGMNWPQVLDANHAFSATYGVDALPHTFTIDADGALVSEVVGVGNDDVEGRVRALITKAEKEAHPRRKLEIAPAGDGGAVPSAR